jgi:NADPH-dependent 2,4-dienoyl-CoA reductase/sulfur reductase-like enzyme
MASQRLVVIGGGAAGMSAASAARRVDPDLEIVVLEATRFAAYGLCGLPYFISGVVATPEALLAYPPAFFRERRRIDLRLRAQVVGVDLERRTVQYRANGQPHRLSWHRLVVAAGGAPALPPLPGLDGDGVFSVRTLEDAIALRGLLEAGRVARALVVGAGYIGLEMAEALAARGCEVLVAELLPQVMANLDAPVAALVEAEVRRHGVDLRLGARVEALERGGGRLRAVVDGSAIAVDVVVVAAGVRPNAGVASAAGAATGPGGALLVDDRMRTSVADVFAAGDCVCPQHLVLGGPAFVPLGPAANKTGCVAGTVAAGGDARFRGIVGTAVVKVFDLAVGRTGLTLAEARAAGLGAVATDVEAASKARYYPGSSPIWLRLVHEDGGRLLGAQLVGAQGVAKRLDVLAAALQAGFHVDDLAALDLSYAPPYAPVYDPVLRAAHAAARRPVERTAG